jgi:nucleoside-diphosphate-sugar epimerase
MPAHVVVFGAGPAGLATTRALADQGVTVRVITRRSRPSLPAGVTWESGDVADPAFARHAARGATALVQALGAPYHRWASDLPPMQASLLAAARDTGARLVSLENLYGYGPVDGPMHEDLPLAAQTRKGRVRADMSRALLAAHAAGDVEISIGRASDFVGPGVALSSLGERTVGNLARGRAAELLGDPDRLHAFTAIDDVGRGLATLALDPRAAGRVFHLPTAPAWTPRAMVSHLAGLLGVPDRVSVPPWLLLRVVGLFQPVVGELWEMRYQVERDFQLDDSRFRETFGVAATPMQETLAATARHWADAARAAA